MNHVIVPLNAFDRVEVLENGQASFVKLIAEAGAFGIEIRRELMPLPVQSQQLERIRSEIEHYGLFTVYSAPIELWKGDHQLNEEELAAIYQEGISLGASWIKVSLGHYRLEQSNVRQLNQFLNQHQGIQLLVENDQTLYGGNVSQLKAFFDQALGQNVPVKMTFDAGNWYYSAQDVEDALNQLAPYVRYLHLKQVEKIDSEFITVPLQKEGNDSWKRVLNSFPSEMEKALEFPIQPKEKTGEFIRMISELVTEKEVFI
jgi:sugar phosphate isomerase/epimerase